VGPACFGLAVGLSGRRALAPLGAVCLSLHSLRARQPANGCAGREGAKGGPPRALKLPLQAVLDALGDSFAAPVGRSLRSCHASGITRASGPGCEGHSPAPRRLAPVWFCTFSAPGLPSRAGDPLGKPFGLSTPGGRPVAVCCRGPLLLGSCRQVALTGYVGTSR